MVLSEPARARLVRAERGAAVKRAPVILGAADGLTIVLGLIVGLVIAHQSSSAVWHAALSGGLAELVGMTAGMWLSDGDEASFTAALACGIAALAACVTPALPYLFSRGAPALVAALLLVTAVAGAVAWYRPQRGWAALTQTCGVLAAAAALTALVSLT